MNDVIFLFLVLSFYFKDSLKKIIMSNVFAIALWYSRQVSAITSLSAFNILIDELIDLKFYLLEFRYYID